MGAMTLCPDPVRLAALALGALIAVWPIPMHAQQRAAGPRPDYRGTGVVEALLPPPSHLHATRPVIVIRHDPIPPLMSEEMSMPFLAASTELLGGLRPGDRITFGLLDTPDALLIIGVERRR